MLSIVLVPCAFIFNPIASVLLLALVTCICKFLSSRQLNRYLRIRPPLKPMFLAQDSLPNGACLAYLLETPMLVFELRSFTGNDPRWIERLAITTQRKLWLIDTTVNVHTEEKHSNHLERHRLLCTSVRDVDKALEESLAIAELLQFMAIEEAPVEKEVFASSASHGWWYSHYYARSLNLQEPLSVQVSSLVRLDSLHHTTITTVQASDITASSSTVSVALDLFLYTKDLAVVEQFNVRTLPNGLGSESEGAIIDSWDLPRFHWRHHGRLSFAAVITHLPMELMRHFQWRTQPSIEANKK